MLVAANPRQQRNMHLSFHNKHHKKHNNRTEELPAVGFEVLALVLKLEGGSGGPARSTFRKCDHQEILAGMSYQCTMCTLCSIFFRATEQAQTYLKIKEYSPIEHIFVPACSSARKIHFFKF